MIVKNNNYSKDRRNRIKYWDFYISSFYTFFWLLIFFVCRLVIPFPTGWFLTKNKIPKNLLSSTTGAQLYISIVVNTITFAYKQLFGKDFQQEKEIQTRKVRSNISQFSKSVLFSIANVYLNWNNVNYSYYSIIITFFAFFVTNSIFEIIIAMIDNYGICDGFNLLFFSEWIPTKWVISFFLAREIDDFAKIFSSLLIFFFITFTFIYISNLEWESPIEINNICIKDNKLINDSFKFGIKIGLGLLNTWQFSAVVNLLSRYYYGEKYHSLRSNSDSFLECFVSLNKGSDYFKNFFSNFSTKNSKFIYALICFITIIYLLNWLYIKTFQIEPKKISEDLKKSGIYFDGITPGEETEKFIRRNSNIIIFIWISLVILLNFIFNKILHFLKLKESPEFSQWFIAVITSTGLFRQIKNKYDYISSYE